MTAAAVSLVTVDVLASLPEERHAEVIDGQLVYEAMTSFEHSDAQLAIGTALRARFGGGGPAGWWLGTEVTLLYARDQGFRHDLAGWRKSRVPQRPSGSKVSVRPDWVCEILSSSNKRKDLVHKRRVLHEQGVPHYWLLDPDGQTLSVLRWHTDGYLLVAAVSPGDVDALEPFDAVELAVTTLFGDIEPAANEGVEP